jgi:hypothetical protein
MRTTSKLPFLLFLSPMLLSVTMLFLGCASTQSATQSSAATQNVRQPDGNPETFWNKFSWSELSPEEQELWGKLGWKKESWDEKASPPSTEDMDWSELSSEERKAAEQLGYSRFYWDSN